LDPRESFRQMAHIYDKHRGLDKQVMEILVQEIQEIASEHEKLSLLDIGCGTGNYSIALADVFSLEFTGVDISEEMLGKAKSKCPEGKWLLQDIETAEFEEESFDVILFSYVVQHIDHVKTLPKIHRFLRKPHGKLLIVTDDHDQFHKNPYHRHIPRIMEIDLNRFPSVSSLKILLQGLGFDVSVRKTLEKRCISDEDDVRRLVRRGQDRYFSTLTLLTDEELYEGLARMEGSLLEETRGGPVVYLREKSIIIAEPKCG
jgi:SAM-dependent methyltransferase